MLSMSCEGKARQLVPKAKRTRAELEQFLNVVGINSEKLLRFIFGKSPGY